MKQKCTNELVRRRVGNSAFTLAAICGVLVSALAPTKMLATEPGDLPPAGTQLAFVREGQIYLINADGSGLIQLTHAEPGFADSDPAWSRDGQRLAFARGTGFPGSKIFIMNADGSNLIQLTSGEYDVEPTWGPDDNTILFSSFYSAGSMGLSVIDVDVHGSAGSRVLFDYPGWDTQPAWSPDGQTITFTSDFRAYDMLYDLYAMNVDGTDVRPLIEGPFFSADDLAFYFQSAWSPDGQSIAVVTCAYAWDNCYPDSAIAVAKADGSGLREIAAAGGYARPTWSPDGRWIAYASSACRSCDTSLRYVRVDGGIEGLLVDSGHSPAWRPDGDIGHGGPDGPVKNPDEPKKPPLSEFPECELKCDKKDKLTAADVPGRE